MMTRPGADGCFQSVDEGGDATFTLHVTIQTGFLIESLAAGGAEVRWASLNILSTQDHEHRQPQRLALRPWLLEERDLARILWCTRKLMTMPGADGRDESEAMVADGSHCVVLHLFS